jgi:hypothetical protein
LSKFTTNIIPASADLRNVPTLNLSNTHGKIEWKQTSSPYILTRDNAQLDIDSYISISKGSISLDSTHLPELNRPATITLYNLTITNPRILKDGAVCATCTVNYDRATKTLTFTVPGF